MSVSGFISFLEHIQISLSAALLWHLSGGEVAFAGIFLMVASGLLSYTACKMILPLALRHQFVDAPDFQRKIHTQAVAYGWGFGVLIGSLPFLMLFVPWTVQSLWLGIGICLLALVWYLDDKYQIPGIPRLIAYTLIAWLIALTGTRIQYLSLPFSDGTLALSLPASILISVGWLVLVINAMNIIDSMDGLAIGIGSISASLLILLSLSPLINQPETALIGCILLGSFLWFFPWNRTPAKMFLWDTGSTTLGLMIGVLAMYNGGKVATASLVLLLPITDFVWAFLRRITTGKNPFRADRLHLHHRLMDSGWSRKNIVRLFWLLSACVWFLSLILGTIGKIILFCTTSCLLILSITLYARYRRK